MAVELQFCLKAVLGSPLRRGFVKEKEKVAMSPTSLAF